MKRRKEVVVPAAAIRRAKPKSNSHHQHTNVTSLTFLQAGCPFCCPTNSVRALKGIVVFSFYIFS